MKQLILFDLDGTLINSITDLGNACNVALRQFGHPEHDETSYKHFVGNGIYKLVERSLPKAYQNEAHVQEVKAVFDAYYKEHSHDQTRPYPGICSMLEALNRSGRICGVITNKAHDYATCLVEQFFGSHISRTLEQRSGIPIKPHPHGIQEMMAYYQVTPESCLYIGDSDVDIQTAKAAGVTSVGVLWGFRSEEELRDAGADYLVKDVEALTKLILE